MTAPSGFPLFSRRNFLRGSLAGSAMLAMGGFAVLPGGAEEQPKEARKKGIALELPPLPYADTALEPLITAKTLSFHYGKHHKAYVDKAKALIAGTELEGASLEEIILKTSGKPGKEAGIFNNAAQVWNHTFYWHSMKPQGGGAPTGKIAAQIEKDFGSLDEFKKQFQEAGETQFGSGWAWLALDKGTLKVVKTANAGNPMEQGMKPILTMDVWEHAYYLDFQNRRPDYIKAWIESLINWDFANQNLG